MKGENDRQDVARRDRDEKSLALSLLQSTLDSTADGILVVDLEGRIVSFNARFVEMWRIPEEILATRDDDRALAFVLDQLRDPESFMAKVRDLYAQLEATSFDVLEFKDGRFFERFSQPQRLEGKPVGRVWSFRDVTDLHKTIAELEEANAQLKELDRIKSDFLASVSHELRTPLAAIQLSSENLETRMAGELTEGQEQFVEIIGRNVARLGRLIGNLLDLASLETGHFTLKRLRIDIRDHVLQAIELFRPLIDSAGLTLTKEISREPLLADADADRIVQIVTNLLENSVRFARSEIHVRLAAEGNEIILSVRNDGPAIADSHREHIFERFTSFGGGERSERMGLGLAIVRTLTEAHGGRITVNPGGAEEGVTFSVHLPAASEPS